VKVLEKSEGDNKEDEEPTRGEVGDSSLISCGIRFGILSMRLASQNPVKNMMMMRRKRRRRRILRR
jgi:hypothetical protein